LKKRNVYLYGTAGGIVLTLLYALPHDGLGVKTPTEFMWIWGNAFSITGVLLFLIAGSLGLDRLKVWDWLLYTLYQARFLLMHEKAETYSDFRDFSMLRQRGQIRLYPIVVLGFVWSLSGLLLSYLYYV